MSHFILIEVQNNLKINKKNNNIILHQIIIFLARRDQNTTVSFFLNYKQNLRLSVNLFNLMLQ